MKWEPAPANAYEIDLIPNTSNVNGWEAGYQPHKLRFTIENDPTDLEFTMYTTQGWLLSQSISNGTEINLRDYWQYDVGDISAYYIWSDSESSGWKLTAIDFYEDYENSIYTAQASLNVFGTSTETVFLGETDTVGVAEEFDLADQSGAVIGEIRWSNPSSAPSSRKMHMTNIEFYNNGVWETKFDNTHWQDSDETVIWTNNRWEASGSDSTQKIVIASGATWNAGYYPTKIRVSYVFEKTALKGP
jgi:hypothetical protein